MTRITLFRQNGGLVGFEASGHSDFADEGSDIVCSAISVLTQSAVMGIIEYLRLGAAYEISEARVYCMLERSVLGFELEKAVTIFETMALGLRSIADNYGDYISLSEREV